MSFDQKFMTTFAPKKWIVLLSAAFFTLTSMVPQPANFSGKWKLNESQSNRGKFLCIYDEGDRMRSKTMKIAEQADFLTVDVASPSPDKALVTRQEKLTFDGKEIEVSYLGRGKKYTAKRSADGQIMTVNSVVYYSMLQGYTFTDIIKGGEKVESKVTEVWKLIHNGKSISVQVNAIPTSGGTERTMMLVYDKAS